MTRPEKQNGNMPQSPTPQAPPDSFGARGSLTVGDATYEIYRINALADRYDVARLPYSIKVVLENLLRPPQELVALDVALVLDVDVPVVGVGPP